MTHIVTFKRFFKASLPILDSSLNHFQIFLVADFKWFLYKDSLCCEKNLQVTKIRISVSSQNMDQREGRALIRIPPKRKIRTSSIRLSMEQTKPLELWTSHKGKDILYFELSQGKVPSDRSESNICAYG